MTVLTLNVGSSSLKFGLFLRVRRRPARRDRPAPRRRAHDLFTFRLSREAAAMANTLGGLDGLVFTGGIGEHSATVRAGARRRLAWLGIEIDAAANAAGAGIISTHGSRVEVRIVPTDEEAVIARQTTQVLGHALPAAEAAT